METAAPKTPIQVLTNPQLKQYIELLQTEGRLAELKQLISLVEEKAVEAGANRAAFKPLPADLTVSQAGQAAQTAVVQGLDAAARQAVTAPAAPAAPTVSAGHLPAQEVPCKSAQDIAQLVVAAECYKSGIKCKETDQCKKEGVSWDWYIRQAKGKKPAEICVVRHRKGNSYSIVNTYHLDNEQVFKNVCKKTARERDRCKAAMQAAAQ